MADVFAGFLEEDERLVWSARPKLPLGLRRLGIPPRSPSHLLWLTLWATGSAGMVLAAIAVDLGSAARLLLAALGGLPPILVGLVLLLAWRRSRRVQFGITDRRRGLLRRGAEFLAFPLPERFQGASGEAGAIRFGELKVRVLAGPGAGTSRLQAVEFPDAPYPASVVDILNGLGPTGAG